MLCPRWACICAVRWAMSPGHIPLSDTALGVELCVQNHNTKLRMAVQKLREVSEAKIAALTEQCVCLFCG